MAPPKEYDFDPRNLPQDLLAAIGLVITSSAQTEQLFESAIAGCLNLDVEYGAIVTTHMPMPLRFSILRSAAEIRIDDLDVLDDLDELLDRVTKAFDKRNTVIHNQWYRDPETNALFAIKETARTRYEMELIPMSVDGVKSDALLIYQVGMDLMMFLTAHSLFPEIPPVRPRAHKSKAARKVRRNKK